MVAVATKWSLDTRTHTLMAGNVAFMGTQCKCITIENTPHFYGVVHGYGPMRECPLSENSNYPGGKSPDISPHDNDYVHRLQQVFFGHAFESMRPIIVARYGEAADKWPELFDFARHVRNGCFHGNIFDIRGVTRSPSWRGLTIIESMNGHQVMGMTKGYFGVADVLALLMELQTAIRA